MSNYIAFELDALNKAPSAARAARVTEDVIIGGLARMWAHCFREKTGEQLRAESRLVFVQVRAGLAVRGDSV